MRRSSATSASGSARVTSTSVRSTASGVRSSWLALATNRRWASKAACRRSSMASNPAASSATSPRAPATPVRVSSDSTPSRRAVAVTSCSGPSTRPTSHHATSAAASTASGNATSPARQHVAPGGVADGLGELLGRHHPAADRTVLPGGSAGTDRATPPDEQPPQPQQRHADERHQPRRQQREARPQPAQPERLTVHYAAAGAPGSPNRRRSRSRPVRRASCATS